MTAERACERLQSEPVVRVQPSASRGTSMDSCGAMAHRAVLLKELGLAQRGAAAELRIVVIAKHLWLMRGTLSWRRTARGCTQ
jgi:hypothetical protein